MGLGKVIVMGLLGISAVTSFVLAGAYGCGYVNVRKGAGAAIISFINAVTTGLCIIALHLDW